jgi:hypothetical protein
MGEHNARPERRPENSHAPGRIDREIDVRSIAIFLVAVAAATVVAAFLMWILFRGLLAREVARDPKPLAIVERTQPPPLPGPRLQVTPEKDLAALHAEEQTALSGYGWVDRAAGRVQIPVERAMALIAERGLPPVAAPLAATAAPGVSARPAAPEKP